MACNRPVPGRQFTVQCPPEVGEQQRIRTVSSRSLVSFAPVLVDDRKFVHPIVRTLRTHVHHKRIARRLKNGPSAFRAGGGALRPVQSLPGQTLRVNPTLREEGRPGQPRSQFRSRSHGPAGVHADAAPGPLEEAPPCGPPQRSPGPEPGQDRPGRRTPVPALRSRRPHLCSRALAEALLETEAWRAYAPQSKCTPALRRR